MPRATDGGLGLVQWTQGRADNLKKFAAKRGSKWNDLNTQFDFMLKELSSYGWVSKLKNSKDVQKAARLFGEEYERYGIAGSRYEYADQIYKRYGSHSEGAWNVPKDQAAKLHGGEMVLPAEIAHSVREVLAGKRSGGGGEASTVNINVTLANASQPEAERLAGIIATEVDKRVNRTSLASV